MPARDAYEHGVPNWVDLMTTDPAASKTFYGTLFGWELEDRPTDQGGVYTMALLDGAPVAGMMEMAPEMAAGGMPSVWGTYISVDDVDDVAGRVAGAGGQVVMPPMQVMEQGRMALAVDPTGATIGFWQGLAHPGAGVVNEPGALCWNELQTPDVPGAVAFYSAVLGWGTTTMDMGDAGEYTLFTVGDEGVAGAMAPPMPDVPPHWSVVFAVDDADATAASAVELGGTVLVEPFDMPIGKLTLIVDSTGAAFQAIRLADPG